MSDTFEAKGKAERENAGDFATLDELETGEADDRSTKNNKPYRRASSSVSSSSSVFFNKKEIETVDTKRYDCNDTSSRPNNR